MFIRPLLSKNSNVRQKTHKVCVCVCVCQYVDLLETGRGNVVRTVDAKDALVQDHDKAIIQFVSEKVSRNVFVRSSTTSADSDKMC